MYFNWTLPVLVVMHLGVVAAKVASIPGTSGETELDLNVNELHNASATFPVGINKSFSMEPPDDLQIGCQELRAKRYISDGFCTSLRPIKEVVCAGQCMPIKEQDLPWWAEVIKYWAKPKHMEWRCVDAVTKLKKVQLMCENGETRTYKIKIVKSCRCKSYEREPNRTDLRGRGSRNLDQKDDMDSKKKARLENRHKKQKGSETRRKQRLERKNKKEQLSEEGRKNTQKDRNKLHSRKRDKSKHSVTVDASIETNNKRHTTLTLNESPEL
ncbi:sclerostin domain-containing protein 1-like [Dreissena polymorpha]|uniref:CTCK domain-containing protein n=1 Tax=Dreissena polymorpha TaxID=45954 RepID=A0A9D3YIP9_DREPO|nr:sclerostin domain-containing protein 1-like [Dreissena polymorpha]KAH3700761.1 hypothetical protein DPMN_075740 [Dreissena polymorpha]